MSRTSLERLRVLLDLGAWLVERGSVTVAEAAAEFGLTPQEVEAEVAFLNTLEVPGIADGVDYGYATAARAEDGVITAEPHDSRLRGATPLTSDEAASMLVALRALSELPGVGQEPAVGSALAKLSEAVASLQPQTDQLQVTLAQPAPDLVLQPLRDAMLEDRQVRFDYVVAGRDELTVRTVDPLRVGTSDGRWYLQAWCHRAGGLRQFRLDKIRAITVLDARRRVLPDDVELEEIGTFSAGRQSVPLVLELEPAGRWVTEAHPVLGVEELGQGRTRVRMLASGPEWAVALGLRLGPTGRVVEPSSVALAVAAEARRALARYPTP